MASKTDVRSPSIALPRTGTPPPTEGPPLAARLARTAEQLFFIVGSGRSGTSLFKSMLSCHPGTMVPNETKFYGTMRPRLRRMGDLTDPPIYAKAVERALKMWWIKDLELDDETVRQLADAADPCADSILLAILTAYAEKHGATRIGEKSPSHIRHLDHLAATFPSARFIHLVRDPRAVVLSKMKIEPTLRHIAKQVVPHALKWRECMDIHMQACSTLGPDRYRVVRYEDLVRNPEPILRDTCAFLGFEFHDSMLEHHKRSVTGFGDRQAGHMSNTLKPLFQSSIDKWREQLRPGQIAMIEFVAGERLEQMGYEPTGRTVSFPGYRVALGTGWDWIQRAMRKFSGKNPNESE